MAKKQTKNTEVQEPQIETMVAEKPLAKNYEKPERNKTPKWEIKDRHYYLKGNKRPLTTRIPGKGIYWFDEEKAQDREMLLTRNQNTLFVDEMAGPKHPQQIIFKSGVLTVNKRNQNLQKLLSLYHPFKNKLYAERDDVATATVQVDNIELQLAAMNAAVNTDIDMAEAIMRAEIGSRVSSMSSKELRRDLLVFAKTNPRLFIELSNDTNIHLRNVGIKATELGIVKLSPDQRTFMWGTNDRKLMTVPFDEHPYSALASWFKTDEGMEVFNSIEKRLQ